MGPSTCSAWFWNPNFGRMVWEGRTLDKRGLRRARDFLFCKFFSTTLSKSKLSHRLNGEKAIN